jgi:hypothetical protein
LGGVDIGRGALCVDRRRGTAKVLGAEVNGAGVAIITAARVDALDAGLRFDKA